ncbi:MAG TPA: TlpA disulfide reductase family protein [Humisphaera sp.]|nr:TlpA disulfide reductase family protein [Humisphaera sp.]
MADAAYAKQITARRDAARQKRAALALELYKIAPHAPELPALLAERWQTLATSGQVNSALSEISEYLGSNIDAKEKLAVSNLRAQLRIQFQATDTRSRLAAIDEFTKSVPAEQAQPMVPQLLYMTGRFAPTAEEKDQLLARVVREYPDSAAAKVVQGQTRKRGSVGSTMELAFKDAITGKRIDLAEYRGKIVVVSFWAAWCSDCAAEIPAMKKIRADYKDKGVEFIGVSLDLPEDEGGLKALRASVARNQIDWPQDYLGKEWDSEFSAKWGVYAVPTIFVLDRQGVIASTDAHGKLETVLAEVLKRSE